MDSAKYLNKRCFREHISRSWRFTVRTSSKRIESAAFCEIWVIPGSDNRDFRLVGCGEGRVFCGSVEVNSDGIVFEEKWLGSCFCVKI